VLLLSITCLDPGGAARGCAEVAEDEAAEPAVARRELVLALVELDRDVGLVVLGGRKLLRRSPYSIPTPCAKPAASPISPGYGMATAGQVAPIMPAVALSTRWTAPSTAWAPSAGD